MTASNGDTFRVTGPLWGNPPVTGGFPSQRLVTRTFDDFFYVRLKKRLSKQTRCRWFDTPLRSLWRHCIMVKVEDQNSGQGSHSTSQYQNNNYEEPQLHKAINYIPWWRHQMETFSALLALYAGNLPVTGEFPSQRPVTRSFDFFFNLRPNKRLNKQSWGWWFETPSRLLWRQCNVETMTTAKESP